MLHDLKVKRAVKLGSKSIAQFLMLVAHVVIEPPIKARINNKAWQDLAIGLRGKERRKRRTFGLYSQVISNANSLVTPCFETSRLHLLNLNSIQTRAKHSLSLATAYFKFQRVTSGCYSKKVSVSSQNRSRLD